MRKRPSIRNALLAGFILFALTPLAIVVSINYISSTSSIVENFVKSRRAVLSGVVESLSARITDVQRMSDLVYANTSLLQLLAPGRNGAKPDYELVRQSMDNFSRFIHYFNSDKYLLSFMIAGDNGLDLRYGLHSAYLDFDTVFASSWFSAGRVSTQPFSWPGMVDRILSSEPSQAIPVLRPLYDIERGGRTGTAVLLFDPRLFASTYPAPEEDAEHYNFTVIGPTNEILYTAPGVSASSDFDGSNRQVFRNGKSYLQTRLVSPEGWTLIETAPMSFVERQRSTLFESSAVILGSFGLFFAILGVFLSRRLTNPLQRLIGNMADIGQGDFEGKIHVETSDEIGTLSLAIARMQDQIKALLKQAIQREQNLNRAEIAALQAQINPHFLSNTLNAIRIMADMQKAEGISSMVQALGGMVRNSFSKVGDTFSLAEEIGVLENYFYILRVRFKGLIRFYLEVADPALLSCKVPRFTLQPLVENAVFHGVEAKGSGGEVRVSVSEEKGNLIIRVHDDGVGMSDETRLHLLTREHDSRGEDLGHGVRSGFGIFNIHRRIRIAYGEAYGLSFESVPGSFTCATVTVPYET